MTAELRPFRALALSSARSPQVGPNELDDRSGFDTDALGSAIWKGCEQYFSTFGNHEISIARKAGSGQPPAKVQDGDKPSSWIHHVRKRERPARFSYVGEADLAFAN